MSPLRAGAVPCLVVPSVGPSPHCHAHPVVIARPLSRAVTRPGLVCVLPGVGCTVVLLVETSLVLLKLKEKITNEWDREVSPPSSAAGLLFGPPVPAVVALPGCCSRCRCRLGPVSVVAVVSVVGSCCTSRVPGVVVVVPVPVAYA